MGSYDGYILGNHTDSGKGNRLLREGQQDQLGQRGHQRQILVPVVILRGVCAQAQIKRFCSCLFFRTKWYIQVQHWLEKHCKIRGGKIVYRVVTRGGLLFTLICSLSLVLRDQYEILGLYGLVGLPLRPFQQNNANHFSIRLPLPLPLLFLQTYFTNFVAPSLKASSFLLSLPEMATISLHPIAAAHCSARCPKPLFPLEIANGSKNEKRDERGMIRRKCGAFVVLCCVFSFF